MIESERVLDERARARERELDTGAKTHLSKKSDHVTRLLDLVQLPQGVPEPPKGGSLLEQGMVLALLEHMPTARAEAAVETLRKAYEDWNEARVAQGQELVQHLAGRGGKGGEKSAAAEKPGRSAKLLPIANAVRNYLQEVYQRTHGLDLEFLRGDPVAAAKVVTAIPMLGNYLGSVLLWLASGGEQPVTTSVMRVLDRLRLLARTSSLKKAREAMEPLIPSDQPLRFAAGFGYVADRWCDPRKPICWECVLVEECPTGKKVFKDWKLQQERQAVHRARDEAKRAAQEKKDAARREREAERARKRDEAARQKAERERERKAKRDAEAKKKPAAASSKPPAKDARSGGKGSAPARASSGKAPAAKQPGAAKQPSAAKQPGSKSGGAKQPEAPAEGAGAKAPSTKAPSAKGAAKPSATKPAAKPPEPAKGSARKKDKEKPAEPGAAVKPAKPKAQSPKAPNPKVPSPKASKPKSDASAKSAGEVPAAKPAKSGAAKASGAKPSARKGGSEKSGSPARGTQRRR